jgi:hypothetical protein
VKDESIERKSEPFAVDRAVGRESSTLFSSPRLRRVTLLLSLIRAAAAAAAALAAAASLACRQTQHPCSINA